MALVAVAVLAMGACTRGRPRTLPHTGSGPPLSYVALGGADVVGDGTGDALRDAWPQVLFRTALPRNATFVNFGSTGATIQDVLDHQVPPAVALRPSLVTISVSDDLFRGTPPTTFESTLRAVVGQLRRDAATRVLVGNIGLFDQRPGYRACLTTGSIVGTSCILPQPVPDAATLTARTDLLNAAIARVASSEGVVVVDVHAAAVTDRGAGREAAQYTDALTPNSDGARALAAVYASALPRIP
jgi:lysophospholipase L1-like esterase